MALFQVPHFHTADLRCHSAYILTLIMYRYWKRPCNNQELGTLYGSSYKNIKHHTVFRKTSHIEHTKLNSKDFQTQEYEAFIIWKLMHTTNLMLSNDQCGSTSTLINYFSLHDLLITVLLINHILTFY